MNPQNDPTPVPGEGTFGSKRTDPNAHTTPGTRPAGSADNPADRETDMADVEGTGGDVPNVGAAAGASNAGRTRTSGGDS